MPFTKNSATLLCYTFCVCIIALVHIISFNYVFVLHLISLSPIHPPLGDLLLKRATREREHHVLLQKCGAECELRILCQHHYLQPLFADDEFDVFVDDQQSARLAEVVANPIQLSLLSLGRSLVARLASTTVLVMSQNTDLVDLFRDVIASHVGSTGGCQNLKRG